MIALNLLSPIQKDALRARIIYAMIERFMIMLVMSMLIASIILLLVKIRLTQNLSQVVARQILSTEYVTVNRDIKELNRLIGRVEAIQGQFISPSLLIRDFASRTPNGIMITGFDAELRTRSLRIAGIALERADLLAFEAALKESSFVDRIESPISNLFQKRSVNFQVQAILDMAALRKPLEPPAP